MLHLKHLFLLISISWHSCWAQDWFQNRPTNVSVYKCNPTTDLPLIYSNVNLKVTNYRFENCPQIVLLQKSTLIIENVSFRNSHNRNQTLSQYFSGGAFYVGTNSTLKMVFSEFIGCFSVQSAACIAAFDAGTTLHISDTLFSNFSTLGKNVIEVVGAQGYCNQCTFKDGSTMLGNVLSISNVLIGTFSIQSMVCSNINTPGNNACLTVVATNITVNGLEARDLNSRTGSVMYVAGGGSVDARNVMVDNCYSELQAGSFYVALNAQLRISHAVIHRSFTSGYGGVGAADIDASMIMVNLTVRNTGAERGASGFHIGDRVRLTLSGSSFTNMTSGRGADGEGVLSNQGTLLVQHSIFRNCYTEGNGGVISNVGSSSCTLQNVSIYNASALGYGGAIYSKVLYDFPQIYQNVSIFNSSAGISGGGMALAGNSKIHMTSRLFFQNNSAIECGGGLFTMDNVGLVFQGALVNFTLNTANKGHDICLYQTPQASLKIETSSLIQVNGNVWVNDATVANQTFALLSSLLSGKYQLKTVPTQILWKQRVNISQVILGQAMPDLSISLSDYYNNTVAPDYDNLILVEMRPVQSDVGIVGETVKALLDEDNTISFSNWSISQGIGNYSFTIKPLTGIYPTTKNAPLPWLSFDVKVYACNSSSEVYLMERCLPIVTIAQGVRTAVVVLAILSALYTLVMAALVYTNRDQSIIENYNPLFLSLIALGCLLCLLSVMVHYSPSSASCMVAQFLDQMGLFMMMMCLILKCISNLILRNDEEGKHIHISDSYLLRYLVAIEIILIGFLIVWMTVRPPILTTDNIIMNSFVAIDQCSSSPFQTSISIARLVIQVMAVYCAYQNRDLKELHETNMLLLTTLNMLTFGSIFSLIALYAIPDPTISFLLHQLSIILPCLVIVTFLFTHKVWIAYKDPQEANRVPAMKRKRLEQQQQQESVWESSIAESLHSSIISKAQEGSSKEGTTKQVSHPTSNPSAAYTENQSQYTNVSSKVDPVQDVMSNPVSEVAPSKADMSHYTSSYYTSFVTSHGRMSEVVTTREYEQNE